MTHSPTRSRIRYAIELFYSLIMYDAIGLKGIPIIHVSVGLNVFLLLGESVSECPGEHKDKKYEKQSANTG